MMYEDIKDAFKESFNHLTYDKKLYESIKAFRLGWMQKSPEYIEFLGGKTLGVQPIRFSTLDEENFMIDVLNVDIQDIKSEIYKVKGINPSWSISSNPIYLSILYVIHKYMHSKEIGKYRDDVIIELMLVFYYKVIGSLISHYFSYTVSIEIATTVVEKLSNRFLIKKLDNWQELFIYRSKDMIPPRGLHTRALYKFTTDDVINVANDAQGRIRDTVKNIYSVMITVKEDNEIIKSNSNITHGEDGDGLKDVTDRPDKYILYGKSIYNDKSSFINDDIIYLINNQFNIQELNDFKTTLLYITEHDKLTKNNEVVDVVISESLQYLYNKDITTDYISRIDEVIKLLKGYWSTSTNNKKMIHVKKHIMKLVKSSTKKRTKRLHNSLTISAIIYIAIRTLVRDN